MKKYRTACYFIVFIIMPAYSTYTQQIDSGLKSIHGHELLEMVGVLSSAEFDGRLSGGEGYNKAARFVSERFEDLGLKPAWGREFFQFLNIEYNKIDTPAVFYLLDEEKKRHYKLGEDFVFRGFTGSADFTLPVVFCGYGISRPDIGFDEFQRVNVEDKIVIVFKQNPEWKINDADWIKKSPREKSWIALEHGARGILFVSKPDDKKTEPLIGSVFHGEGVQPEYFPQLHVSIETADEILSASGYSIEECQERIDRTRKPLSFFTGNRVGIKVNAAYKKNAKTMNVIGIMDGVDAQLKNEYLIIGAHLDHIGSQAGLLYPGANDNASGSAGVLKIAEAFQLSSVKPKRSILFVLFAGEEQGLYGSRYFAENLNIEPESIAAMFNLDCVGYGDSIQVGNGKSSPVLWNLVNKIDGANLNLMINDTWSGGGADATPFHEKEIPCLYFASKYSYDHLHQPSDTPETLNPELYESLVKLAYLTARKIVDGEYEREKVIN